MALATGVGCRRCSGTLKAEEAHTDRGKREPVQPCAPPPLGSSGCRLDGGLSTTTARTVSFASTRLSGVNGVGGSAAIRRLRDPHIESGDTTADWIGDGFAAGVRG